MRLDELTDVQVAGAFINQDQQQRRQDAVKTPQQLARDKGADYAADKTSNDPLKVRIAQLRQQLATLVLQDQKRTADAQKQQGQQPNQQPTQQQQAASASPTAPAVPQQARPGV